MIMTKQEKIRDAINHAIDAFNYEYNGGHLCVENFDECLENSFNAVGLSLYDEVSIDKITEARLRANALADKVLLHIKNEIRSQI